MNPLVWAEHVLAVAGFAWLVNRLVEWLASVVGRQREIAALDRELAAHLRAVWRQQQLAHQQMYTIGAQPSAALRRAPKDSGGASSELEELKRRLTLAQWAGSAAWQFSRDARREHALTELYSRAARTFLSQQGSATLEDVRQIADSALRHEPRPDEVAKGLLYDIAAMYLQACQLRVDAAAAASLVPIVMEECAKSTTATADELLQRWQQRVRDGLDTYQPASERPAPPMP